MPSKLRFGPCPSIGGNSPDPHLRPSTSGNHPMSSTASGSRVRYMRMRSLGKVVLLAVGFSLLAPTSAMAGLFKHGNSKHYDYRYKPPKYKYKKPKIHGHKPNHR